MSQPTLVGGFEGGWWLPAARVVGGLLLISGIVLYSLQAREAGLACSIAGGLVVIGSELTAFYGRRQRRWLEDLQTGFLITDLAGTRQYHDEDVVAVGLDDREVHRSGVLHSVQRLLRLWTVQDSTPTDLWLRVPIGQVDPLATFRERILTGLLTRCEARLAKGESVEGSGWRLGTTGLNLEVGLAPERLRFEEISAVDLFDRKVCVWKVGQDRPAFTTPVDSKNALLLAMLVEPRLKQARPEVMGSQATGLGRVLFERGATWGALRGTVTAALGACAVGVILLAAAETFVAGLWFLAGGAALWIIYFALRASRFQVHERGLYRRWLLGERQVRFADLESFTYQAIRQFVNGMYTGTTFTLAFQPRAEAGGGKISYSANLQQADAELDLLRDRLAQIIGQRMALELKEGRSVTWTPALTIHPDALEYRPRGWFGRKPPMQLPFAELQGFDLQAGVFHVWRQGKQHSVIQETIDQPNFFAGFWLLTVLFSPEEAPAKEEEGQSAASE
jgi:hypothetical protein